MNMLTFRRSQILELFDVIDQKNKQTGQEVVRAVEEVLGQGTSVSLEDQFVLMGGDSLSAVRLQVWI